MRPIFTHPAVATEANGTNLPRIARAVGDRERSLGTRVVSPTAMEQDAIVADAYANREGVSRL